MEAIKIKLRVDDQVEVICGKDKGRVGKLLRINKQKNKGIVERINMVTRHIKPTDPGSSGQRIKQEAMIDLSNLMLICPECTNTVRTGNKILEDGTKVRVCKGCSATIVNSTK